MKNTFTILILLLCSSISAQSSLIGKTYVEVITKFHDALIGEEGDDCLNYPVKILSFDKDSVLISFKLNRVCPGKETLSDLDEETSKHKYKWIIKNNQITIFNSDENLRNLSLKGNKIIRTIQIDNKPYQFEYKEITK